MPNCSATCISPSIVVAADVLVMVGLAAHDAAQRDEAVEPPRAAHGDADRLRQFVGAGDVQQLEGGAGLAQHARAAPSVSPSTTAR